MLGGILKSHQNIPYLPEVAEYDDKHQKDAANSH